MNFQGLLAIAATIIGLVAAAGAVVAFARASYAKATIEALRGDIHDRDARIESRDDTIAELQAQNGRLQAAVTRQGKEIEVLRDLATNKRELTEFVALAHKHEEKAEERHNDQIAMDEQILRAVHGLTELMERKAG